MKSFKSRLLVVGICTLVVSIFTVLVKEPLPDTQPNEGLNLFVSPSTIVNPIDGFTITPPEGELVVAAGGSSKGFFLTKIGETSYKVYAFATNSYQKILEFDSRLQTTLIGGSEEFLLLQDSSLIHFKGATEKNRVAFEDGLAFTQFLPESNTAVFQSYTGTLFFYYFDLQQLIPSGSFDKVLSLAPSGNLVLLESLYTPGIFVDFTSNEEIHLPSSDLVPFIYALGENCLGLSVSFSSDISSPVYFLAALSKDNSTWVPIKELRVSNDKVPVHVVEYKNIVGVVFSDTTYVTFAYRCL